MMQNNFIAQLPPHDILQVAESFYTNLYTPNYVGTAAQDRLLSNIRCKLTGRQRQLLDAPITVPETKVAVYQLNMDKNPGLDGISAAFYQRFWDLLHVQYDAYVYTSTFSTGI